LRPEGKKADEVRLTVWTVGHSTRSAERFLALLGRRAIAQLVDVRRVAASRRHPHFNRDALTESLSRKEIRYRHLPALGGRRESRADSPNTGWREPGFRGYADYMQTAAFERALATLCTLAANAPTAILCAEADWRSCHRGLIADRLKAQGAQVLHIVDAAHDEPHPYTSPARIVGGKLSYPSSEPAQQELDLPETCRNHS
jgi:uncharacterized protein (DUF488 family)